MIKGSIPCVFRHTSKILQRLSHANTGCVSCFQGWVSLCHSLAHILATEPFALLVLSWQTEAMKKYALHVVCAEVWEICLLHSLHLIIAKPVRSLVHVYLVQQLGIKLGVIDWRSVVDELSLLHFQADIAATACRVAKRMLIVGCGKETRIATAIFLRLTEDRTAINLNLRERLLQLALLSRSHVGKLVNVDKQVVGERHLAVKLIAKIDVIHEVAAQMFWQQADSKRALAASLLTNQYWHTFIAVQHVDAQPMCHGRAHPCGAPRKLFARNARNAAEQVCHMVLSVPLRQAVKKLMHRIVCLHSVGVYVLLDVLSWRLITTSALL